MRHNPGHAIDQRGGFAMRFPIMQATALHATVVRIAVLLAVTLSAGACGSVEYRDSNAAVDANPLCASAPSQPGEPVSKDCERTREAGWRLDTQPSREPLDFSGGSKD
jgi:hypothetical protein